MVIRRTVRFVPIGFPEAFQLPQAVFQNASKINDDSQAAAVSADIPNVLTDQILTVPQIAGPWTRAELLI